MTRRTLTERTAVLETKIESLDKSSQQLKVEIKEEFMVLKQVYHHIDKRLDKMESEQVASIVRLSEKTANLDAQLEKFADQTRDQHSSLKSEIQQINDKLSQLIVHKQVPDSRKGDGASALGAFFVNVLQALKLKRVN